MTEAGAGKWMEWMMSLKSDPVVDDAVHVVVAVRGDDADAGDAAA